MRVGNYSVLIPEGTERDSGHVGLEHGRQYTLRLMNHDYRRCDAEVTIDGKAAGVFRLNSHGQATLERMPDDHGRLTFYTAGTADAGAAGEAAIATPDKGLIQVRFVPELRPPEPVKSVRPMGITRDYPRTMASMGGVRGASAGPQCRAGLGDQAASWAGEEKTAGGITGLSGHSDQRFTTVGAIDRDEFSAVTISLRLVTGNAGPRPLKAAGARGNPVPATV